MAFDVYQLSDQQIELGYFASDVGTLFGNGKFIRLTREDFREKPSGNGMELLKEGVRADMIRKTKSGAYAMIAKHVQQIVSVHDRPGASRLLVEEEDVYSQFESLDDESHVDAAKQKEQPVLTYMGSGLAIVGLTLSSFISNTGFVGLFTVALGAIGFILSVIGTILFFKAVRPNTPAISKLMHVVLTIISLVALGVLAINTFMIGENQTEPVELSQSEDQASVSEVSAVGELETGYVELTQDELRETISFEHGPFSMSIDATALLNTGLPVSVTNVSDQRRVYNITVDSYNMNGDKVGLTDYVMMADIGPGETFETTLFEYMTSVDAEVLMQEGITFDIDYISVD